MIRESAQKRLDPRFSSSGLSRFRRARERGRTFMSATKLRSMWSAGSSRCGQAIGCSIGKLPARATTSTSANVLHVGVNRGEEPAVCVGTRNEPTAQESLVLYPEMDVR